MQKWEYKTINSGATDRELNNLGEQGWELVAASNYSYIFKRPKS